MKKFPLVLAFCIAFVSVKAQTYEEIRNKMLLNQFDKAKIDLDKAFNNAKFTAKPEAYILKTAVYAGLANSDFKKNTEEGAQLLVAADQAFQKYKEMDPSMALLKEPSYQNGPINLYSSYYSTGFAAYQKKNWAKGLENLKKAVQYSDVLIQFKLLTSDIDTNVLVLAGSIAESGGYKEDAAVFYSKLAKAKVAGDGFEGVYRFLESDAFARKDIAAFEAYKKLGKELYPKSDYFDYDKVDFAVGLTDGFENKLKAVEEVLAADPDNFKANQVLGELIYDTLNPRDEEVHPVFSNYDELEKKMVTAFGKSAKGKPGYEIPYLYIGDHFINKSNKVNDKREAFTKEMKARTKPGTMFSKEDIAKRDALDKEYGETLEGARAPYEAACKIFAEHTALEARDKQQYKKASSYLADIYGFKKSQALKAKNLTEKAKFEAEEKKWNDVYESIKN
jgi:hypothetical protein